MVVNLRNVFRRIIQVGFIDGIGLEVYAWGRSKANVYWQQAIVEGMTKLL
jgi:hypothetical protein